jgi:apolipoprotein N-acyltransferase
LAGAIHALAFAPGPLPGWALAPLQCLALAVLAYQTLHAPSVRQAALGGFTFGSMTYLIGLHWLYVSLHVYGGMIMPLAAAGVLALATYLAIYPALACAVTRWLTPWSSTAPGPRYCLGSALVFGAAWAGAEWLRGILLTGFPWLNIGYAHVDSPLAGWSTVLGVYGVALFAAFGAAALASLWRPAWRALSSIAVALEPATTPGASSPVWPSTYANIRRRRAARPGVVALVALMVAGTGAVLAHIDWTYPSGTPLRVDLVQGSVPQSHKFDPAQMEVGIANHMRLALKSKAHTQPDMVLLPETVLPILQDQLDVSVWENWLDVAERRRTTVVMGAPLHTRRGGMSAWTNSVIGIDAYTPLDAIRDASLTMRYDKRHLVPFGEFVPKGFRWFIDAMQVPLGDFNRGGKRQQPFWIAGQRVAFNICYEDLFGEELLLALHVDDDGLPGATVLANVSNLGWFGNTWALRQHWQITRLRAIETARPMLSATNTGITGAIDHHGRALAMLAAHVPAILPVTVQGMTGLTPYARLGNGGVLALVVLSLAVAVLLRCRIRAK